MNSRERILAAINHKQPDRIPVDLGATPSSGISAVAYHNLINYLGINHLKNHVYDVIQEVTQPEMELLELFKVDVLDIGRFFNSSGNYWHKLELMKGYPGLYPKWFNPEKQPDGSWLAAGPTGEYIGKMPVGATFFDQLIFPYVKGYPDNFNNISHDMSRVIWGGFGFPPYDRMNEKDFWKLLRETIIEERSKTDKALLIGVGCNLFEWGTFLRRIDNFLMDLYLEPVNVHRLLDKLLEMHLDFLSKICKAVGDIVEIIKFGDDLGTNTGPFMPNEIYNEFFRSRHKIMCDYVKANSSAHTMLHCCGGIYELIPELIEAGFEILNPVQINAVNMEPERLKKEFGSELTFWGGGCNTQSILNRATPQQVKDHVRHNLEIFSAGGGYVFNSIHNIMPDVPPENIMAMFETVQEFH
ncbi:MAG: uroporphyrinogen decarboxylase family protein [Bacteroidales bacterium]|nr:uroporphyrinogen decarboxylase family protein [Bacteroidales bacterium]